MAKFNLDDHINLESHYRRHSGFKVFNYYLRQDVQYIAHSHKKAINFDPMLILKRRQPLKGCTVTNEDEYARASSEISHMSTGLRFFIN